MTTIGPAEFDMRGRVFAATVDPVQAVPEYTVKVTVPLGAYPPIVTAVSVAELPTMIEGTESEVFTVGDALATTTVSEPQRLLAGLLLESPL